MAIMAAAAIVGAGISIYGAVDASNKEKKAKRDLESWNKSHAQDFRTGQQIYDEAAMATPSGYSPAEKAAFDQAMARRSNASRRLATDRNPNLSGAVNAAINYGNIQGLLQFASQDAQLRRNEINRKVGLIQGQSNAQTQFNQNVSGQYGQAIQQQHENFTNSLYNVANSAAAYGYFIGPTGKNKKPKDTTGGGSTSSIPTTSTPFGNLAIATPLQSTYQRQAAPLYENYQPGYDPYRWSTQTQFSTPY